ncbi:lipoprotein signal peptidase [Rudanella lutea]|uniref:lipoprotein signal peptidase n=1 Tax=Rudanella lutea TaxID=451374 RepID=UPI000372DE85|nr:lipoprotein signal peptidase [Rudanella lutea]
MIQKNPLKYFLFAFLLIGIDQASKMAVHHFMQPGFAGQISLIGDWLKLHYVLNPGMAFGMQLSHDYGKLILSLFRLVAMVGIGWYLVHLARQGAPDGLLWAMAMIMAGAVGNVIDSTFYGVLLGNAPYGSITPWFHGQVIDMVFVDIWEGFIPDWVPLWGGQYYSTPIFNIADACIFVGVCIILFFQRRFFRDYPDVSDNDASRSDGSEHGLSDRFDTDGQLPDDAPLTGSAEVLPAVDAAEEIEKDHDQTETVPVAAIEGQPAPELDNDLGKAPVSEGTNSVMTEVPEETMDRNKQREL